MGTFIAHVVNVFCFVLFVVVLFGLCIVYYIITCSGRLSTLFQAGRGCEQVLFVALFDVFGFIEIVLCDIREFGRKVFSLLSHALCFSVCFVLCLV